MSRALSMSPAGPMSYSGANSYSYSYSYSYGYGGLGSYHQSGPLEAYGFDGTNVNPMLADGLEASRVSVRRDFFSPSLDFTSKEFQDVAASRIWSADAGSLPKLNDPKRISRYGVQVRSSLVMLELLSSIRFSFEAGVAVLQGSTETQLAPLVTMTRPTRRYFEQQIQAVDSWSSVRKTRQPEILTQVAPPTAYFASLVNLQASRHRYTMELLTVALQFSYAVCMMFKHTLACPRPSEFSASIGSMLEVPPHPALPAGHASEAHLTATILSALAGASSDSSLYHGLRRVAHRIAENRVVAGLHFPIDNAAGRLLGDTLAEFVLAACRERGTWRAGSFDGAAWSNASKSPAQDEIREAESSDDARQSNWLGCSFLNKEVWSMPRLPVMGQLWDLALKEWDRAEVSDDNP